MLSINTNISSLITQRSMKSATNLLNQAVERMTTGYKVNHASDNAAHYAIATEMTTKLNSLQVAEENAVMGLDMVNMASEILDELNDRIERLRALQEQANNGTLGEYSLNAINKECNALVDEINRIYKNSEYNGIALFLSPTTLADGSVVVTHEADAQLTTTFEEMGVTSKHFEIYDANDSFVQAYDLDDGDTIDDLFSVLQNHGFNTKLHNGEIAISSAAGLYITGDLASELGISIKDEAYISSTSQSYSLYVGTTTKVTISISTTSSTTSSTTMSTILSPTTFIGVAETISDSPVEYVEDVLADESTQLGEFINFGGSVDMTIRIEGTIVAEGTFSSTDTVEDFLNFFREQGRYATISEGIIVIDSHACSLVDHSSGGILEQMGMYATSAYPVATKISIHANTTSPSMFGVLNDQYITLCVNGTESIITVKTSDTFADIRPQLTSAGISTSVLADGSGIAIFNTESSYIVGITPDLSHPWGWSTGFASISISATQSEAFVLDSISRTLSGDTTFADLGISSGYNISIVQNGTGTMGIPYAPSKTIDEFISDLADVGITATIVGGRFKIETTSNAYIETMPDDFRTALKLYTTVATVSTTVVATGSTTFKDLGVNSAFKVTVVADGTKSTISIDKDTTFDQLFEELQDKGITVSESAGRVELTGDGDTYIKSEKLNDLLNMNTLNKTEEIKKLNTKSSYLSYDQILEDVYAPGIINLQVGTDASSGSSISMDVSFKLEDLTKFRNIGIDGADYLDDLDSLLANISTKQVQFGAAVNRLESVIDEIGIKYDNLVSSRSTLRDADIAEVSSQYIQQQILQQASATLMATANQMPSIALQLI